MRHRVSRSSGLPSRSVKATQQFYGLLLPLPGRLKAESPKPEARSRLRFPQTLPFVSKKSRRTIDCPLASAATSELPSASEEALWLACCSSTSPGQSWHWDCGICFSPPTIAVAAPKRCAGFSRPAREKAASSNRAGLALRTCTRVFISLPAGLKTRTSPSNFARALCLCHGC